MVYVIVLLAFAPTTLPKAQRPVIVDKIDVLQTLSKPAPVTIMDLVVGFGLPLTKRKGFKRSMKFQNCILLLESIFNQEIALVN